MFILQPEKLSGMVKQLPRHLLPQVGTRNRKVVFCSELVVVSNVCFYVAFIIWDKAYLRNTLEKPGVER